VCGICGYVGDHQPELLEAMCAAMAHRGPDDQGRWTDEAAAVGLGHRRLSIIDLSPAGHQPMSNEDGTVWISYNGELYNFQEHRPRLEARGHRFVSQTDTEVLVHLYEEEGPDFLQSLNGMFAIAIWDARRRQLLLARDHAGIKPLYYWERGGRLYFASEIRALLKAPGVPRALNAAAVPAYLTFLWLPGRQTLFQEIRKVEPGGCLIWKDGRTEVRSWFRLAYEPDESVPEAEWVERVHDTLLDAIRRQMVSDVPLGAFLSGGTDSSSIVACMRQCHPDREIKCYTYDVPPDAWARDQMEPDYPYACRVAELLNLNLHSMVLQPDVIQLLPKMIFSVEEPDADPSVFPNYLITKQAREDGTTVLLSGMGGDEVFLGYRSFQALRLFERLSWIPRPLLSPALRGAIAASSRLLGAQSALPRRLRKFHQASLGDGLQRYLALSDWSSEAVRQRLYSPALADLLRTADDPAACLNDYYAEFQGRGEMNRRSHVLVKTFLGAHNFIYSDKSSMANSLEVRVPYMDLELMRLCAAIPERLKLKGLTTKFLLKKAMERYLPTNILYRSKAGFAPPLRKWIAEDLAEVVRDLLSPQQVAARGLFRPAEVESVVSENCRNQADHAYLVYALVTLELWTRMFIDRAAEEVVL